MKLNLQQIIAVINNEDHLINYLMSGLKSNPKKLRKTMGSFDEVLRASLKLANMPEIQLIYKHPIIKKHFNRQLPSGFVFSDALKKEISNVFLTEVPGGWRWNGNLTLFNFDNDDIILNNKNIVEVAGHLYIGSGDDEAEIPESKLTNLIGCPQPLDTFEIDSLNELTSLEGMPDNLKKGLKIMFCRKLKSLEHCSQNVNGNIEISYNKNLESLKGITNIINGDFINIGNNEIDDLGDGPELVEGDYILKTNNIRIGMDDYPDAKIGGDFIVK